MRGEARLNVGERLAEIHARKEPDAPAAVLAKDRERYLHAPLVVVVIARVLGDHKIPEQEQVSAGCVAYNLLLGAQALGFGAQWLTGWAAYDREVAGVARTRRQRARDRLRARGNRSRGRKRTSASGVGGSSGRMVGMNRDRPHAYLVDASLYVFRAWHSIPPDFTDVDGHPVNAVHGFTRFLLDLLERAGRAMRRSALTSP